MDHFSGGSDRKEIKDGTQTDGDAGHRVSPDSLSEEERFV